MPRLVQYLPRLVDEGGERFLVAHDQGRRYAHLGHVRVLAVDKPQVAIDVRIDLGRGKDLDHVNVKVAQIR